MDIMPRRPAKTPPSEPIAESKPTAEAPTAPEPSSFVAPSAAKTSDPDPKKRIKHPLKYLPYFKHTHLKKWQWAILYVGLALLIAGASVLGYKLYKNITKTKPPYNVKAAKAKPKPTTEPSKLTGVTVDIALNQRPVTGVMIENSPDARPQSGLTDAGVVVEAIAEGGITRFLALYQEAQPSYIGPVRSARPYYLDFALTYNASLAHVGGSPEAISQIRSLKVRDLDQFYNPGAYQRISQRYAPHNVYTSMAKLDALNNAKGFKSSTFTGLARKKDKPSKDPVATSIGIDISSFYYNTHYNYDTPTNSYKRSEGGSVHNDEKSKKQITPKVVVALVMKYSIQSDGKHSQYGTTGSGEAVIFQDGEAIKCTWKRESRTSQVTFTDAANKPVKLNAGQTWITLVDSAKDISYRK